MKGISRYLSRQRHITYLAVAVLFLPSLLNASFSPKVKIFRSRKEEPKVRVRIADSLSHVTVSGTDLERLLHPKNSGKKQKRFSGRKKIKFKCSLFGKNNPVSRKLLLASVESPTGLVTFGGHKYRGRVHVVADSEKKACDVVNEIRMEQYLSGLLSKEMNSKWPIEALKAQAVAARTYALSRMKKKNPKVFDGHGLEKRLALKQNIGGFYDLENSEKDQVSGNFFDSTLKTDMATSNTRGEVLMTGNGNMTPIFFHASCGGKTRLPQHVWTNSVDSYQSVNCHYCKKERGKSWSGKLSLARVKSFLKWAHKRKYLRGIENFDLNKPLRLVSSSQDTPLFHLYIGDQRGMMNKQTFRRFFGRVLFPSTHFSLKFQEDFWKISGRGNGHGVGLCQVGARSLALKGWDYRKILRHYFPGHQLAQIY